MNPITIRPATVADVPFLWDMLYEAAIGAPELRALSKAEVLRSPGTARYLDGWGRAGDAGVIAEDPDGGRIGAAWYRIFQPAERGAGIVALPRTPELAIGVHADHRGRGIGSDLLATLIRRARDAGYAHLMLSVDPTNPAVHRYERHGFRSRGLEDPASGTSLIMQLGL